jgi:SWI/SNF-related matrix-associated actin-dependent regulator of chromatin subfamily D
LPLQNSTKFSHFVRAIHIELLRDTEVFPPETNVIEYQRPTPMTPTMTPSDGFEIKRNGDMNIPCKIKLFVDRNPEIYQLPPALAQLLDIQADTKANIISAIWFYVKHHSLQDSEDRRIVHCDERLTKVCGVKLFMRIGSGISKVHVSTVT